MLTSNSGFILKSKNEMQPFYVLLKRYLSTSSILGGYKKVFIRNLSKILVYSLTFNFLRLNVKDINLKLKVFLCNVLVSESFFILLIFPILNVNGTHFQILFTTSKKEPKGGVSSFCKNRQLRSIFF